YQAIYVPSISVTCIFFCLLFILYAIMNSLKLLGTSILNLVHGDTHADSIFINGNMTGIVAIISLILLGTGYLSMYYFEKLSDAVINKEKMTGIVAILTLILL